MSSYHLNRFLFDLKMNEAVLKRASADLQSVMNEYDLTAEEKEASSPAIQGDFVRWARMGWFPFISFVSIPRSATTSIGRKSKPLSIFPSRSFIQGDRLDCRC